MKRFLSIFLFVALTAATLSACGEDVGVSQEDPSFPSADPIESFDSESVYFPDESADSEKSFSVKDIKYTYEGNDLVILEVKNTTDVNYSVTVTGQYLDENGAVLKTETKSFDQFYAGYRNYFLFHPQMQFADFSYTLDFEIYSGKIFADAFGCRLIGLEERGTTIWSEVDKGNYTLYPAIFAAIQSKNESDIVLQAYTTYILINSKDEIIAIFDRMFLTHANEKFNNEGANHVSLLNPTEPIEKLEWPEKYKGEIRAVICIKKVTDQIQY